MALREKIEPDFLMCACADYNIIIFPGKYVHIYNRGGAGRLRTGMTARISSGHILPMVDIKSAQIGSDDATRLR